MACMQELAIGTIIWGAKKEQMNVCGDFPPN